MDGIPVTLIVKAPNQQIEDQTIQCELSWTIKKLKGYLSEVYPSKPRTEEQKLIYSGQLLADSVVLKDVLRRYEGQETHTVHLVCTPPRGIFKSPLRITTDMNRQQEHPVASSSRSVPITDGSQQQSTSQNFRSIHSTPCTSSQSNTDNDARNSRVASAGEPSTSTNISSTGAVKQNETNLTTQNNIDNTYLRNRIGTIEFPQIYGMDNNQYAAQLAMFQHNYMNYLNHYMQLYANQMQHLTQRHVDSSSLYRNQQARVANNEPEPGVEPQMAVRAEQAMPAVPNVNMGGEADDGVIDRDWLDWFYVLSRLIVLFSIVYFYSSPIRFLFVFFLGCAMYLYQIGIFHRNNLENNNQPMVAENNNNRQNNNEVIGGGAVDNQANDAPVHDGNQNGDEITDPTNNRIENVEILPDRPTVLGVMWTFFTTFFTSLIPEIPNPI